MNASIVKVLFVCLGNICRSPAAEGVFKKILEDKGLANIIKCDSAGTSAYHKGSPADSRMSWSAKQRGYELTSLSRPFLKSDFEEFDFILTMDNSNYQNVLALDEEGKYKNKIKPFVSFCRIHEINEVPDPYYDKTDGFNLVMDIVEDGCNGFIEFLIKGKIIY